ncbi:MAG: hypothetical protein PCFJNLEI_02833 [Verrucomicrobiae bacterium]|nr:hypothetical protein [Verrucomicrobiae bacterium]
MTAVGHGVGRRRRRISARKRDSSKSGHAVRGFRDTCPKGCHALDSPRAMNLFENRPFKTRNAEEFELNQVLDLFVDPAEGARNPFEFENVIVKGRQGSGKTMYLRANLAYHSYSIVPSLLGGQPPTLPVLLRLSDFQHIRNPEEIYREVVISIVDELANSFLQLLNAQRVAQLHLGMQSLPANLLDVGKIAAARRALVLLRADEYEETITRELGTTAAIKCKPIELAGKLKTEGVLGVKKKAKPGVADIRDAFNFLLGNSGGSILLLIDEAGQLDESFFRTNAGSSLFETLMNQLRTQEYIRTKIAVYPHSYSDTLTETRYGDLLLLTDPIRSDVGYKRFRGKTLNIIQNYLSVSAGEPTVASQIFDTDGSPDGVGDCLEQIIYGSDGNIRRLMLILDLAMEIAHAEHGGKGRVTIANAFGALVRQSEAMEILFSEEELGFLEDVVKLCKSRSCYKFQFPKMTPLLTKYCEKSNEHNILKVNEIGTGRRPTTYEFDYAFCIHRDIPTHCIPGTERVDKNRSFQTGAWITRKTNISKDLAARAKPVAKQEGVNV